MVSKVLSMHKIEGYFIIIKWNWTIKNGMVVDPGCCLITESCLTLCDAMDCSPLGSSVHGTSQARILEWVASSFSREAFWSRDWTWVSCISCRQILQILQTFFLTTAPLGKRWILVPNSSPFNNTFIAWRLVFISSMSIQLKVFWQGALQYCNLNLPWQSFVKVKSVLNNNSFISLFFATHHVDCLVCWAVSMVNGASLMTQR